MPKPGQVQSASLKRLRNGWVLTMATVDKAGVGVDVDSVYYSTVGSALERLKMLCVVLDTIDVA